VVNAQKGKIDLDESIDFSNYSSYQFPGWQDDGDQALTQNNSGNNY
jgi:hypothetical protein